MRITLLGPTDFIRMPWKNGLGVTTELAVARRAGEEGFDWRISTATVAAPGPFSSFPGIDRSLAIVRGGTLALDVEGQDPVTLTTTTPAFAFAGEAAVMCAPALERRGVALDDFNVMTRRGVWQQTLARQAVSSTPAAWALPIGEASVAFLYVCGGVVQVDVAGERMDVPAGHAARFDGADAAVVSLQADSPADAFLTTLTHVG